MQSEVHIEIFGVWGIGKIFVVIVRYQEAFKLVDNTFKLDAAGYYNGKHIHVRDKKYLGQAPKVFVSRANILVC